VGPLARIIARCSWLIASVIFWVIVYDLIVVRDVGSLRDFWAPARVGSYVVFILAPAVTFIPIAHTLHIPLYDLEAIAGWSTLAFTVAYIDPGTHPPLPSLLLLLVSLTIALATICTLVSYAVGLRLFARRSERYDFVRARRDGYLMSMFLVGLLLLAMLNVLSVVNAALLGLILLLLELFLLSRGTAG
jgi:hypothetical protein